MRGPEGHESDPPADPPSLVGDPPADPPAGDPPAGDPPAFVPPADQAALDAMIKEAVEKAQPQSSEPITVEALTLPEGFELQEEMGKEFLEILNGDQSPQDRANALIALHTKNLAEAQEADSKAWDKMQTEWRDEVKADSDVGGDKLQPALANIGKLLDEFGTPELKGVFDMTGAGNNVHMIKFLNKIAGKLTEGNFFSGGVPSVSNDPDAAAKRMYPSMKG